MLMSLLLAAQTLVLQVTFRGQPMPGLAVTTPDAPRVVTGRDGKATFRVDTLPGAVPPPYLFRLESEDFVLKDLRGSRSRWRAEAVHSAAWRQRQHPRPCDEWSRVIDIPRGTLPITSADEYDAWYASLTPRQIENCRTLARAEKKAGSKAPWYLYEYKAMPRACKDGKYANELDWTAWYRGLLEESTHASPGKCVEDWERWWAQRGYPAIPDR